MPYYTPAADCGSFRAPFEYRYCCPTCGRSAVVLPAEKVRGFVRIALVGVVALGWLCFSDTVRQYNGARSATKMICIALVVAASGLFSLCLLTLTFLSRHRYPLITRPSPVVSETKVKPGASNSMRNPDIL